MNNNLTIEGCVFSQNKKTGRIVVWSPKLNRVILTIESSPQITDIENSAFSFYIHNSDISYIIEDNIYKLFRGIPTAQKSNHE